MKHLQKIFFLHLAFFITFSILSLFLWGAGHGSSAPFVIFHAPFLTFFYAHNFNEIYSCLAVLQMPLYGLICYLFSTNKLNQKYRFALPFLHVILAFIAIFALGENDGHRHYYFFVFSLLLMIPYWIGFFRLSKSNQEA